MTDENTTTEAQAEENAAPGTKIKAMRRQPCPCGSGKVFKNCHEGDPGYEVATDASEAAAAPPSKAAAGPKKPGPGFPQQQQKFSASSRNTGAPHRQRKV